MKSLLDAGDYDAVVSDCFVSFSGDDNSSMATERSQLRLEALGRPPELSPISNIYGAGSLLIKRSCFIDLGGFNEGLGDSRYGHWEMLNRLQAAGGRISSVPVPLVYWHLDKAAALGANLNHEFIEYLIRPWLEGLDFGQENIFRYAVHNLIEQNGQILNPKIVISERESRVRRFFWKVVNRLRWELNTWRN